MGEARTSLPARRSQTPSKALLLSFAVSIIGGGGLTSYGSDYPAMFRRAGNFVARILNGESAAELPTKFDLIINLKWEGVWVHCALLLADADEVIE
jgi:putative ABC transport system substrate-binding protein